MDGHTKRSNLQQQRTKHAESLSRHFGLCVDRGTGTCQQRTGLGCNHEPTLERQFGIYLLCGSARRMSLAELQDRILGYLRLDSLEVESGQAERGSIRFGWVILVQVRFGQTRLRKVRVGPVQS